MNGQPTAQNTRETGADGDLAGFRNWDNPRAHRGARRALERRAVDDPALGAADARDADLPLRRAGLDQAAVDLGDQSRGLAARSARIRRILAQGGADGGRAGPVPDRDRRARGRRPAGAPPGARRPARSPTPTAPSTSPRRRWTRPARPARTWTSSSTTRERMDFQDRDGAPLIKWRDPESAFEAWKACSAAARATTAGSATRGCAVAAASSGHARRGAGGDRATLHRRPLQHGPGLRETFGQDLDDRRRLHRGAVPRAGARAGAPSCTPPTYQPSPEVPSDEYPFLLTTGAPSTTSTRAPRPAARRSSTPRRRTSGWRSAPGRRPTSASPRGTCVRGRVAARRASRPRAAQPDPARASSSCRSTTATGTPADGAETAARRERAHDHRLGPGLQAADLQGRRGPR